MNHPAFRFTVVAGLSCAAALPATAAVVRYDSPAAFAAALPGVVAQGFDGIATSGSFLRLDTNAITVNGVTFTSNGRGFVIAGDATQFANYGRSFFTGQDGTPNSVEVTLGGASAIGFLYGSYFDREPDRPHYQVSFDSGEVFDLGLPVNRLTDLNFVGFISDADPITRLTFASLDTSLSFDIAGFAVAPAPVPVPGMAWVAGLSLCAIGTLRRRAASS